MRVFEPVKPVKKARVNIIFEIKEEFVELPIPLKTQKQIFRLMYGTRTSVTKSQRKLNNTTFPK